MGVAERLNLKVISPGRMLMQGSGHIGLLDRGYSRLEKRAGHIARSGFELRAVSSTAWRGGRESRGVRRLGGCDNWP